MADIDDSLIEELNQTLKTIAELNLRQEKAIEDIGRRQVDPNYKGGAYGSIKILDVLAKGLEKLGQKMGQGGGSGSSDVLSDGASHPDNDNPAARIAKSASQSLKDAAQYIPIAQRTAAEVTGDINRYIVQPGRTAGRISTGLNQMGELQGLSAGGGDINIGGIGIRTPFNAAAMRGLSMKFEAFQDSMQAGITRAQAEGIQQAIVGAGYNQGDPTYNRMKTMFQAATQMSSVIGQDPRFQEMAISGTRFGGASMGDMLESLNQIKDTAKAIHVNQGQMLEDAQGYQRLLAQTGGNPAGGMLMAAQMGAITGLPGQTTLALQNNPFVMARQMQSTGLLPWQLGQMSSAQRAQTTYQAFDMVARQMGPSGPTTSYTDAGGFQHISTGRDKQDATIAMMMGLDVNVVKQMRRHERQVMARARTADVFQGYTETASNILHGRGSDAQKISRLRTLSSMGGRGTAGELTRQMRAAGASAQDIDKIMNAKYDTSGAEGHRLLSQTQARQNAFKHWMERKSGKETGMSGQNKITVGLSSEAKKLINLSTESEKNKAMVGIGVGALANAANSVAPGVGSIISGAAELAGVDVPGM